LGYHNYSILRSMAHVEVVVFLVFIGYMHGARLWFCYDLILHFQIKFSFEEKSYRSFSRGADGVDHKVMSHLCFSLDSHITLCFLAFNLWYRPYLFVSSEWGW